MLKFSKRKLIVTLIIVSLIIFIFINFILLKYFNIQKKQIIPNFIQTTNYIDPINTVDAENIVKSQYKSNNWRIKILKINLDAPILEGTEKEILRRGVGHFENTGIWYGNVCLAAHNRGYKYNYFQEIKKLEIGDIIIYETEYGIRQYEVITNKTIKETDLSVLKNTKENMLTLLTCEENKREYRRCIQAKEV